MVPCISGVSAVFADGLVPAFGARASAATISMMLPLVHFIF